MPTGAGHGPLNKHSKVRYHEPPKLRGHTDTYTNQTWRSGCFEPNYSSEEGFNAIAVRRQTEPGRPPPERRHRPGAGNPRPRPPALPRRRPGSGPRALRDQRQPRGGLACPQRPGQPVKARPLPPPGPAAYPGS